MLNVSDLVRTIRKDDAIEDRFKQIQSVDELKDTINSALLPIRKMLMNYVGERVRQSKRRMIRQPMRMHSSEATNAYEAFRDKTPLTEYTCLSITWLD